MRSEVKLSILADAGNNMAGQVLEKMKNRAQVFFRTDAFLAAIYLDPRYVTHGGEGSFFTKPEYHSAIVSNSNQIVNNTRTISKASA